MFCEHIYNEYHQKPASTALTERLQKKKNEIIQHSIFLTAVVFSESRAQFLFGGISQKDSRIQKKFLHRIFLGKNLSYVGEGAFLEEVFLETGILPKDPFSLVLIFGVLWWITLRAIFRGLFSGMGEAAFLGSINLGAIFQGGNFSAPLIKIYIDCYKNTHFLRK